MIIDCVSPTRPGFIGSAVCSSLRRKGYDVQIISRSRYCSSLSAESLVFSGTGLPSVTWDQLKREGLPRDVDVIVQLSVGVTQNLSVSTNVIAQGANIMAKPWTEIRKAELMESRHVATCGFVCSELLHCSFRIGTTRTLIDAIRKTKEHVMPKVFVCGSAVGLYPTQYASSN